jgi:Holliday junction resolvasome RuvABC DNA-binding subunit
VCPVSAKRQPRKVVIELRDKLALFKTDENGFALRGDSDVIEALKTLGYTSKRSRVMHCNKFRTDITDTNTKIKEALKLLGK